MKSFNFSLIRESQLSDGLNYFLLSMLFLGVMFLVVGIWMFAKWLTVGPKLKRRKNKFLNIFKKNKSVDGVGIKKGEIIIENDYLDELDKEITNTTNPQELLKLQNKKVAHIKEKEKLERTIKEKEEKKLEKIERKKEMKRIKEDTKQRSKELKDEAKKNKKEGKK